MVLSNLGPKGSPTSKTVGGQTWVYMLSETLTGRRNLGQMPQLLILLKRKSGSNVSGEGSEPTPYAESQTGF